MIEDDLRALLADRAGTVSPNARRGPEVRARIRATRRRRTAGTALALVLLAIAGLVLTRLPGRPDALPTGVPAGPYFRADGTPEVAGYMVLSKQRRGPVPTDALFAPDELGSPVLLVARCERAGTLVVRHLDAVLHRLDCNRKVAGGFEGIVPVEPTFDSRTLEPDRAGVWWDIAVLRSVGPDPLPPAWSPVILSGTDNPDGGTVEVTLPASGFFMRAQCVRGVRLLITVPRGPLTELTCDEAHWMMAGEATSFPIEPDALARLGLRPGAKVVLTVRSVGRSTDQWRLERLLA